MNKLCTAIIVALGAHAGQVRKGDGEMPYIVHPLEVAIVTAKYTSDENEIIAALLHDTVEDTDVSIDEIELNFGPEVASLVASMTEKKHITDWVERKLENISRLRAHRSAYVIKSIDALSNMQALLAALELEGSKVWDRFNAPRKIKLSYFRTILDDTQSFLPQALLKEYVETFKDLEYFQPPYDLSEESDDTAPNELEEQKQLESAEVYT